jgi:S-adenosylmethionine decarboxylase
VTGVLLLAESHISIHTWPERNFAAVDIFMCAATDVERAAAQLIDDLEPDHIERASMERGQRNQ